MAVMIETFTANWGSHTIEVRGQNDIIRGLIYSLFLDGKKLAEAHNFLKLPTQRSLEARVNVDGTAHSIHVAVQQNWLDTDYILTVNGESLPLTRLH